MPNAAANRALVAQKAIFIETGTEAQSTFQSFERIALTIYIWLNCN